MATNENCDCGGALCLIFSCSGAADVGAVADQAARKIAREGHGKMHCIAGIGGRVSGIVKSTEAANTILAIDGCPLSCAKNSLQEAGIMEFRHLQLADLGMQKGKTEVSSATIDNAADAAVKKLVE